MSGFWFVGLFALVGVLVRNIVIIMGSEDMSRRKVTYAVEQRVRFIELLLVHYGFFKRQSVVDFFGVSKACVSRDVDLYRELAPGNVVYSKKDRSYQKSSVFVRFYS